MVIFNISMFKVVFSFVVLVHILIYGIEVWVLLIPRDSNKYMRVMNDVEG